MDNFKSFNDFRREQHRETTRSSYADSNENHQQAISTEEETVSSTINTASSPKPRRRRKRSTLNYKKILILTAAFICVFIVSLFFLPISLGSIVIKGSNTITLDDVLFEAKIKTPVNTLRVSGSAIEDALSHDYRVEKVNVTRVFPLTIDVDITDRIPLAVVQDDYGYAFIDKTGLVMETVQSIHKVSVPMITGKRFGNLLIGDHVSGDEIDKAMQFLNHLKPESVQDFSEINIGNPQNIIAYTRDGITVRLGNGSQIDKQAELAEDMVGDVKARGLSVEFVDANLASPYIKLKK